MASQDASQCVQKLHEDSSSQSGKVFFPIYTKQRRGKVFSVSVSHKILIPNFPGLLGINCWISHRSVVKSQCSLDLLKSFEAHSWAKNGMAITYALTIAFLCHDVHFWMSQISSVIRWKILILSETEFQTTNCVHFRLSALSVRSTSCMTFRSMSMAVVHRLMFNFLNAATIIHAWIENLTHLSIPTNFRCAIELKIDSYNRSITGFAENRRTNVLFKYGSGQTRIYRLTSKTLNLRNERYLKGVFGLNAWRQYS